MPFCNEVSSRQFDTGRVKKRYVYSNKLFLIDFKEATVVSKSVAGCISKPDVSVPNLSGSVDPKVQIGVKRSRQD